MANTESDRKEKGAEVLGEDALDGIAGGGGVECEEMADLLRDAQSDPTKAAKMLEDIKKSQQSIVENLRLTDD